MPLDPKLPVETARRLTVPQLRALCRARGWSPTSKKKDGLVEFVAPRLLDPSGADRAMATLPAPWLRVLHGIAMAGGSVELEDAARLLGTARKARDLGPRAFLRQVSAELLTAGVVLVEEHGIEFRGRHTRPLLTLHLPPVHRERLPVFPVETSALGSRPRRADPAMFFRDVLQRAGRSSTRKAGNTLAARVAAATSLGEGPMKVGTGTATDLGGFLDRARRIWCEAGNGRHMAAQQAALHVLGHLPEGEGVGPDALAQALKAIGRKLHVAALGRFLDDGLAAGFLSRGGTSAAPCYRLADAAVAAAALEDVAMEAVPDGLRLDIASGTPDLMLGLFSVGRWRVSKTAVEIEPHPVLLGRCGDRLDDLPGLAAACETSPAWKSAAARVKARHGTLTLHRGLLVLRVKDAGLAALVDSRLGGHVRTLADGVFAVPATLEDRVERLMKKQGYALRRLA